MLSLLPQGMHSWHLPGSHVLLGKGPSWSHLSGGLVVVIKSNLSNLLLWSPVSMLGGAFGRPPVVAGKERARACSTGVPVPGRRRRCVSHVETELEGESEGSEQPLWSSSQSISWASNSLGDGAIRVGVAGRGREVA